MRQAEFDARSECHWLASGSFVEGSPPAAWSSGAWARGQALSGIKQKMRRYGRNAPSSSHSASGCFDGWASAKAGMAMQVS
jgi:hypothetical protein